MITGTQFCQTVINIVTAVIQQHPETGGTLFAMRFHEFIGVLAVRDGKDFDVDTQRAQYANGSCGSPLTGFVCIITDDNLFTIALDDECLFLCQCSTKRCNGIFKAGLMQGNHVHVAFD